MQNGAQVKKNAGYMVQKTLMDRNKVAIHVWQLIRVHVTNIYYLLAHIYWHM